MEIAIIGFALIITAFVSGVGDGFRDGIRRTLAPWRTDDE